MKITKPRTYSNVTDLLYSEKGVTNHLDSKMSLKNLYCTGFSCTVQDFAVLSGEYIPQVGQTPSILGREGGFIQYRRLLSFPSPSPLMGGD